MKLERLPEPWLDPENFTDLNRMFYGAEPHEYFSSRLSLLVLAAGKPDLVEDAIRDGISYEGLKVGGGDDPSRDDSDDRDEETEEVRHKQFVITETLVLLHHVSETVVRFFLAHERLPACPWIEIAGEPMRTFRKKVAARFDGQPLTGARRTDLAKVFYGSTRPGPDGPTDEEWDASLDNIEAWLTHLASWFLADAHVWNSLKHGLAVQSGEPSMELRTPADEAERRDPPLIHATGPGVTFLEKWGDEKLWHVSTRWLKPFGPAELMGEIYMACCLLRSMWQVGRARYLSEPQGLRIYNKPTFEEFMHSTSTGIIPHTVRMNMLYRYAYPPNLTCSECRRSPAEDERARLTWRMYRDDDGAPQVLCADCAGQAKVAFTET